MASTRRSKEVSALSHTSGFFQVEFATLKSDQNTTFIFHSPSSVSCLVLWSIVNISLSIIDFSKSHIKPQSATTRLDCGTSVALEKNSVSCRSVNSVETKWGGYVRPNTCMVHSKN